jgi:hypothetical protein
MHNGIRATGTTLLVLAGTLWFGCTPSVVVRREIDQLERPPENVAVLLFANEVPGSPPHFGELATDAFTLAIKKYFPGVVDRYQLRDFLRSRGSAEGTALTPAALRAIGEEFDVDGVFVGTITGFGDKRSFLGWKDRPYFLMGGRLLATDGRVLIAGQTSVTESVPLPVDDPKQMAVYGVKSLIVAMRLDERLGPPVLTRADPLWRRAMRDYEERCFWEAAEGFAEIVASFRPGDLREEARLYEGRSLEEVGFDRSADLLYAAMREGPFAASALARSAEIGHRAGDAAAVLRIEEEITRRFPGSPEEGAARYLAGLALIETGSTRPALGRLESVPEESPWFRFARYALAGPYLALGDTARARGALDAAADGAGRTESDRRLRARALLALGDLHFAAGRPAEADRALAEVTGEHAEEAAMARAWMAAEGGRFEDALRLVRPVEGSDDRAAAAEASLVTGSCRARLGLYSDAARAFREAIARCDAWKEREARDAERRSEREEARRELAQEIEANAEVLPDLLAAGEGSEGDRLRSLKNRCRALELRIERTGRELGPSLASGRDGMGRREIRERADFSLAQVLYQIGREETREAALMGGGEMK